MEHQGKESLCDFTESDFMRALESKTPYTDVTGLRVKRNKIPRPVNSFLIWSTEERRQMKSLYPKRDQRDVSRLLGWKWTQVTREEKERLNYIAHQLHLLHRIQFPSYKYKPKKSRTAASKVQPTEKEAVVEREDAAASEELAGAKD